MKKSEWVTAEEAKARTRWLAEMNALMELLDPEGDDGDGTDESVEVHG